MLPNSFGFKFNLCQPNQNVLVFPKVSVTGIVLWRSSTFLATNQSSTHECLRGKQNAGLTLQMKNKIRVSVRPHSWNDRGKKTFCTWGLDILESFFFTFLTALRESYGFLFEKKNGKMRLHTRHSTTIWTSNEKKCALKLHFCHYATSAILNLDKSLRILTWFIQRHWSRQHKKWLCANGSHMYNESWRNLWRVASHPKTRFGQNAQSPTNKTSHWFCWQITAQLPKKKRNP